MDIENKQRKTLRFQPKAKPRQTRQSTAQKPEEEDGKSEADLLRCFNERTARQRTRVEMRPPVQVAFDQSAASAPPIRTYGVPKDSISGPSSGSSSGPSSGLKLKSPEPNDEDQNIAYDADGISPHKTEKHYRGPWEYQNSYYPSTLPLRKPHAGDPEILDEQEFGEAARNVEYDESTINSAVDLGLMPEGDSKDKLMLFQLPTRLPLVTNPASAKGKEKIGSSVKGSGGKFEEVSEGFMGKLQIYKSGKVKLKLGETLFDVSPGSKHEFCEMPAAINTENKECCFLGEMREHVIVTPDVDAILDAGTDED